MEEELIRNQDINIYFGCNFFAERLFFSDEPKTGKAYSSLIEELYNKEEIISKISTENLLIMLAALSKDKINLVESELVERMNKEKEPFVQSNFEIDIFGKIASLWQKAFVKLSDENIQFVADRMKQRITRFEKNDFTEVMKNCQKLFNYNLFVNLYEKGLINEQALPVMQELAETRKELFNSVNFFMFQDEFLKLDKKAFFHIIRYPNICKRLTILKDNSPELLETYITEINNTVQNNEHISTLYTEIENLSRNFALYCPYFSKMDKSEVLKYGLIKYDNFVEFLKQKDAGQCCNLEEFLDNKYRNTKILQVKREIVFNKYFSISFREAERLVKQYGTDLQTLQSLINEDDFAIILKMKEILECTDLEKVDEKYQTIKEVYDAKNMIKLESNLRSGYAKTYISKFDDTRTQIQEQLNNSETESIEYNGKKIPVIKLKGEAHVLIHSSDSGFKGEKKLKNGSFKQTWDEKEDQSQHIISTTHNDSSFHGVAPINENGVYMVFLPKDSEILNLMGNTDINSHVRSSNFISERATYLIADNMSKVSRRVYQEFGIEESEPDAIAIFDDMSEKYKENAYKAAMEFDIPIILYSKKEIIKDQKENLERLLETFNESMDVEILKEIISGYETNKAGWLLNRENHEDEIFTKSIDNTAYLNEFDELGKKIRNSIEIYLNKAKQDEIISLNEYMENERNLYQEQNSLNLNFAKVEMSDFLNITLDDCKKLITQYCITTQDIFSTEEELAKIERGESVIGKEVGD